MTSTLTFHFLEKLSELSYDKTNLGDTEHILLRTVGGESGLCPGSALQGGGRIPACGRPMGWPSAETASGQLPAKLIWVVASQT